MISSQIYQAIEQVRDLQQKILESQRFKGYSGRARAICGAVALFAAAAMSYKSFPAETAAHALGWGMVALFGVLLNFGSLVHWFLFDPSVKRDFRRLKPTLDALPAIAVGGVMTYVFIMHNLHQYLFGTWMCLFGLANLASRLVLPRRIWMVGVYYIACGSVCLWFASNILFLNPWPMGIVFFIGEWAGGLVLHFGDHRDLTIGDILSIFTSAKEGKHAQQI
ncbi:MAG: hypothetical protein KDE52_06565 [Calditrichaeota bacterium]|nr:hypothetical protein [Calditrichota bacterium]